MIDKGGRPPIGLLESEIRYAQEHTKSNSEAARFLHVSYNTYKKYAKAYGLFEQHKNQEGKGVSKYGALRRGKFALKDILEGKYPNYDRYRLKARLLTNGLLAEKCAECGFDEKRMSDGKIPLILDNINGDRNDYKYDNLRLLCLNCYFLYVGNLSGKTPREYTY